MGLGAAVQFLINAVAVIALTLSPLADCCSRHPCEDDARSSAASPVSPAGQSPEAPAADSPAHSHHAIESGADVEARQDGAQSVEQACPDNNCDQPALQTKDDLPSHAKNAFAFHIAWINEASAAAPATLPASIAFQRYDTGVKGLRRPVFLLTQRIRL